MKVFRKIPKIHRGPIYLVCALLWWFIGKFLFSKPLSIGVVRTDYAGPAMIVILIYYIILLALLLFGIFYTIQGVQEKIKNKKKVN